MTRRRVRIIKVISKKEMMQREEARHQRARERAFEIHGDDSSDEEEAELARDRYSSGEALDKFLEAQPSYLKRSDPNGHSFFAYSLGEEILRSEAVDKIYYKKKNSLGKHVIHASEEELLEWLQKAIKKSLKKALAHLCQKLLSEDIYNTLVEKFDDPIVKLSKTLLNDKRALFKQGRKSHLIPALRTLLNPLVGGLLKEIDNMTDFFCLEYDAPIDLESVTNDMGIQVFVLVQAEQYLRDNGLVGEDDKLLSSQKKKRKLKNLTPTNDFETCLKRIASDSVSANIEGILRRNKSKLCQTYITMKSKKALASQNPCIFKDKEGHYSFGLDVDIQQTEFVFLTKMTCWDEKAFLPRSGKSVKAYLNENLKMALYQVFPSCLEVYRKKCKIAIERPLLPQQHTFYSHNTTEYLANLRLAYRNVRRRVRQFQDDDAEHDGETTQRAWRFGSVSDLALEDQEVTVNLAERDKVLNLKRYEHICDVLIRFRDTINKTLSANDKPKIMSSDLARWVLHIIKHKSSNLLFTYKDGKTPVLMERGELKALRKKLVEITYLLFGCEVLRNPAGLVTQMLLIEAISKGEKNWGEMLNKQVSAGPRVGKKSPAGRFKRNIQYGGGEMPMSMSVYSEGKQDRRSEPVAAARTLQEEYGPYSLHFYRYPGEPLSSESTKHESQIAELARREQRVIETALEDYKGDDESRLNQLEQTVKAFYS